MANCDDKSNNQSSALVPIVSPNHNEHLRRPRGRPAGSKNKPKPPLIIARENPTSLRAYAMEITSGFNIFDCIANLAHKRQRGICILSASGCVANVTLRQSGGNAGITLHGRFEILSLLGSFFPPPTPVTVTGLTIYLAGNQGQVVGGSVVGPLIASGPVVIMAASFTTASFERLPVVMVDEEVENEMCNQHCHRTNQMPGMYGMQPEIYDWVSGGRVAKS